MNFLAPVLVLVLSFIRPPVDPQATWRHSVSGGNWLASATASEAGGTGTWQTTLQTIEYRGSSLKAPWGVHVRYGTGSQGNYGGTFSGATSGTDTFWSADATWIFRSPGGDGRVFAGYGSFQWETVFPAPTGTRRATSAGVRFGADTSFPVFHAANGGTLSVDLRATLQPWNQLSVLSGGTTTVSPDSSSEWTIALRYKLPGPTTPTTSGDYSLVSLVTVPDGIDPWAAVAIRYTEKSSPYRWTGVSFVISKTF